MRDDCHRACYPVITKPIKEFTRVARGPPTTPGSAALLFDAHVLLTSHFVIDGGFLLHKVIWDRNSSFKDITTKYVKYVQEHFGLSASIVFDGYSDDPDIAGTKSWERLRRTKKHQSTEVKFDKNTIPTLSQEKFLGNEKNKSNFIILLKTVFSEMGFTVDQAESDADALIVRTALAASPLFNTVTIVAEDIDILILLTVLGRKQANVFFFKPSKGRTAEQLYSASGFMYGDVIANNLLFLHAFSGCDTTSAPYNIGKMKFVKTLEKHLEFASGTALFLNKRVDPALLTVIGERFFISLYGGNKDDNSLDSLRYKQFAKAVTKSTFNLSSLPPTQDTARFHTFRVYHQVQSWLGNYNDPEDWGWKKCGKLLMPVQNSKPPAPLSF
ncbi:hypothetical protein EVAR_20043_1 [Eumeta japonica]|uniref:Constitutive coactivator of peroxisome proliferator-activated receptor gamma n=1 Tax=Eumeta variegata TaxID=151549 RepID=A0A4C1UI77_EUMVA|nr:hypothetical protein EVAR_20043_1 [Eumeta japonica]